MMGKYTLVVTDTGNDIGTLTGQTLSLGVLSGSGPKGDGWTGVTFDNSTNVFTFTSNDGLGYVSDPVNTDVATDTTPQLGGDLDLNNNDITGTGNINITGTITASSTITSNDLVVNGDLTVSGTTTTVNTETINLADNIILVNSNYTGSTPTENGGIEVERGTLTNKSFVWDETNDKWTVGSETFVAGTLEVGTITVTGTVDGRDVATDGSKLDGIEAGATADQTDSEIKTAYENNADTNAFTDAEKTKLAGIEAGADVTDTANVTAAGALMDSEVTNLAAVKAFDPADYATAAQGTNADTAFGWGDHAAAGYLTAETDATYTSSSWYTTTNNSANWDTAYGWGNHASAGYLTASNNLSDLTNATTARTNLDVDQAGTALALAIALG